MALSEKSSGPKFVRRVPEGDELPRRVCEDCGFIDYENPKIVVGSVCYWRDKLLLCRRAIDPRKGYWTLPAGYLEQNEAADAGARREAWEEARAEIEIEQLLGIYSIARISQVQLIFRARLLSPEVAPGPETLELDFTGDRFETGFNARYLLDCLGAILAKEVVLELTSELSPAAVRPVDDPDQIAVIMPMRM